jgi:glycosyltransferase involved in cell wall biosynthesis
MPCSFRRNSPLAPGLSIHGFVLSEVGLGESARMLVRAAQTQDFAISVTQRDLPGRENVRDLADLAGPPGPFRGSLVVAGLPDLRGLRHQICRRQHNIAYPYWELSSVPAPSRAYLGVYDTLWAPSSFIRDSLERSGARNVKLLHQPVHLQEEDPPPILQRGEMRILTYFDYDSFVARKNPEASVRAFQAAFPLSWADVRLTVKTRGSVDRGRRNWLREKAASDPRITVIDDTLSREGMTELMLESDVFLSLHRSEGFGFGCAEAIAAGRAVVATDYGGVTDFINESTGYPVTWTPLPLRYGDYFGWKGATWADPSVEEAAEYLRSIYDDSKTASTRTTAGRALLRAQHSFEAAGERMRALLEVEGLI